MNQNKKRERTNEFHEIHFIITAEKDKFKSNSINHQQTKTIKLNFFNLNVCFVLIDELICGAPFHQ